MNSYSYVNSYEYALLLLLLLLHFTAVCVIDAELLSMACLHCMEVDLSRHTCIHCVFPVVELFQSCDPDLDPMTFIYELDLYCSEIYQICKYELPT